ncbi:MAG: TIGR00266 family protein [Oscillospiraceae bacterium]|nr:TIGR00266 family protein [Oscillospiraceae bacterium]
MKYEIQGGQLPVAVCDLEAGEEVFTQSGGMSWMGGRMVMSTKMDGGLMKGLGRAVSGESMFMNTYKADGGPGMIAFASSFPGSIVAVDLEPGKSIICQKKAFLAASRTVTLAAHLQKKMGAGFFGGEGFIMQRITGPGTVFLEIDGAAIEYDLQPGVTMQVDTGHVAIMDETVKLNITAIKGVGNVLFGGEGLFNTTLTGPGHVWLQSMPIANVARSIKPFVAKSN